LLECSNDAGANANKEADTIEHTGDKNIVLKRGRNKKKLKQLG